MVAGDKFVTHCRPITSGHCHQAARESARPLHGEAPMSIRVTTSSDTRGTILKVDGRLRAEDVSELAGVFGSVQGASALDLSDLQSADRDGVEILRQFISLGAEVRGASPYIELLLKRKGDEDV
jgi:hypothetical protein